MLFSLSFPGKSFAAETQQPKYDIQEYANAMQPGWNLGNSFDGFDTGKDVFDETAWGNPRVTKELIDKIAQQGFKSIRIPITFATRLDQDNKINSEFLDRIQKVVDWSLDAGMKVMINVHHDSWNWIANMPYDHDNTVTKYNAIWTQLADRFKDYPLDLMFESLNEPQFYTGDTNQNIQYLNELNASFYHIVRNSGGKNDIRPLVLPTLNTGSEPEKVDALYNFISGLHDPYIIATVHYYGYWPFSVNIAGYSSFEKDTMNDIVTTFDRVHDKFSANGIPVVIGEYGLLGFDQNTGTIEQGEKLKYFEFMINYAQEKGLVHMLWDNGQHFNRTSYVWNDPQLYEMMKESWSGHSATADTDFIYLKQGVKIKNVTKKLDLKGNHLASFQLDGRDLKWGKDYVLDGEDLIIKASFLSGLRSDKIGKIAILTAHFNHGANWYFNIYKYDTPVFGDSQGTTSNFMIPVQFNGTQLRTMEAKYTDDGSNAGPQNWTSYKEFGYAFSPSIENNNVSFPYGTDRFFKEVADGREVELTFHFWSGEAITYKITKNGDQVAGTALEK